VTSQDPQLSPATPGKPRDLAAVGHVDQLDWLVLPYASRMRPRGKNAARQRTARAKSTRIITGAGVEARVDVTGASSDVPAVRLRTTYRLRGGRPWVEARTTFHNTGSSPATLWVGDAIDRDGIGQRCGVAGHGTIMNGPRDYVPARPWIGMVGADRQVYGLLYDDAHFVGYAARGWVMSQKKITLRPGASTSLRRRVVAVDTGSRDPWSALDALL